MAKRSNNPRWVKDAIERGKHIALHDLMAWIDKDIAETKGRITVLKEKRDDALIEIDAIRNACVNAGIPLSSTSLT